MTDDQYVLLALQLHDHWLQALDQVLVGLSTKGQNMALEQGHLRRTLHNSQSSIITDSLPSISLSIPTPSPLSTQLCAIEISLRDHKLAILTLF